MKTNDEKKTELREFGKYCEDRYNIEDCNVWKSEEEEYVKLVTAPQKGTRKLFTEQENLQRYHLKETDTEGRFISTCRGKTDAFARRINATRKGLEESLLSGSRTRAYEIYAHENLHHYFDLKHAVEEAIVTCCAYHVLKEREDFRREAEKLILYGRQKSRINNKASLTLIGKIQPFEKRRILEKSAEEINHLMNTSVYHPGDFNAHEFLHRHLRFVNNAYFSESNPYSLLFSTVDTMIGRNGGLANGLKLLRKAPNSIDGTVAYVSKAAKIPPPPIYGL